MTIKLFDAICDHDTETLLKLISEGYSVNFQDERGYTPLHVAADLRYGNILSFFLEQGADPNIVAPNGATPLSLAVEQNHYYGIRTLAASGADLSHRSKEGLSYLDLAFARPDKRFSAATALLDCGVGIEELSLAPQDEQARLWYYWTAPAIHVSGYGDTERLKAALEHGTDPDSVGYEPLLLAAARSGNVEQIQLLISYGADLDIVEGNGHETALYAAAFAGHREAVQALIEAGANLDKPRRFGAKPIDAARRNGYGEIVQDLLEAGANPEVHVPDREAMKRHLMQYSPKAWRLRAGTTTSAENDSPPSS